MKRSESFTLYLELKEQRERAYNYYRMVRGTPAAREFLDEWCAIDELYHKVLLANLPEIVAEIRGR